MSEEQTKSPEEQPSTTSGEEDQKTQDNKVAYETYQKVLGEKKKTQERFFELEQKLKKLEEEKLEAEGKKEELAQTYKQRWEESQKKLSDTTSKFAWNVLTNAVKLEATKHGCKDATKLIRLMDDEDLKSITIGEDYSIDSESLKSVIEKNKKENEFLFNSNAAKPVNGIPGKEVQKKSKSEDDIFSDYVKNLK